MIRSMTAFGNRDGQQDATRWSWEVRSVNGRGLDLRLRLPETLPGLEAALRDRLIARLARGNVSVGLRLQRAETSEALALDEAQLDRVLAALGDIASRAQARGLALTPPSAADVLASRGVMTGARIAEDAAGTEALVSALLQDFDGLLDEFLRMRTAEGAALARVIDAQLATIADLLAAARAAADARHDGARAALRAALARLLDETSKVPEERLEQELALIATRGDITEEIDRLDAHVAAARALLADEAPAGRRLDFLAQEFNREANTLCAKSGAEALTRIGLDLKAAIDQMREQIQNVE